MPDSQINYTTTGPDGSVGAKFTGEIAAKGLRLDAVDQVVQIPENPNKPPAPNRIEWRDILELLYTRIETAKVGNDSQLDITAMRNDGLSFARLTCVTMGDVFPNNTAGQVLAYAKGIGSQQVSRKILDGAGNSDFALQSAADAKYATVYPNTSPYIGVMGQTYYAQNTATSVPTQVAANMTFTATSTGYWGLLIGSGGYTGAPGWVYYYVAVNGVNYSYMYGYWNEVSSHKTLTPVCIDLGLRTNGANVNVQLVNYSNIVCDNDFTFAHFFRRA